ncbi:MAG: helix-turn-helix transcriptional regulator [Oscillospiraceae bacterium]|nr:helix-turn-helix transcriptional regulator [Oscillospiraceae bacterium]
MFTLEAFGKKIKALRRDRGLSQQQLADNLFVSRKTVGNWETGNRFPDITMISKLADELRVETYELLDEMNGAYKPTNVIVVDDEPIILKGFVHILTDTLPDMQIAGFQTGRTRSPMPTPQGWKSPFWILNWAERAGSALPKPCRS